MWFLTRDYDGKVTAEEVASAAMYLKDTLDKEGIQELIANLSKDRGQGQCPSCGTLCYSCHLITCNYQISKCISTSWVELDTVLSFPKQRNVPFLWIFFGYTIGVHFNVLWALLTNNILVLSSCYICQLFMIVNSAKFSFSCTIIWHQCICPIEENWISISICLHISLKTFFFLFLLYYCWHAWVYTQYDYSNILYELDVSFMCVFLQQKEKYLSKTLLN